MRPRPARSGFTLVEMLVAVGLVVLMMAMFATIFQLATGAMSKQKGLAENDQKARRAETTIKADIGARTYRRVIPIQPNNDPAVPAEQQGYFSISENDPDDDADDVLSFTVTMPDTPIYGRASKLKSDSYNQPEFDDGQINENQSSSSTAAEVCYFMRNGNLYRRVMLIRKPYVGTDGTPKHNDGTEIITDAYGTSFLPTGSSASGEFWRDFDFSAYNAGNATPDTSTPVSFLTCSGNGSALVNRKGTMNTSLGMPNLRFGHSISLSGARPGCPIEYINSGTEFIGRYLHEETSDSDFGYPGRFNSTTCPMKTSVVDAYTFDPDGAGPEQSNGIIPAFRNGPRRGEDLMLTGVHAFDIKVFDEHPGVPMDSTKPPVMDYRDIGYEADGSAKEPRGYFWSGNNANKKYGPRDTAIGENQVFDTWHPDFVTDSDNDGTPEHLPPPYTTPEPLKSIQIRLRYLDPTSQQMRDVTLIQSLVD